MTQGVRVDDCGRCILKDGLLSNGVIHSRHLGGTERLLFDSDGLLFDDEWLDICLLKGVLDGSKVLYKNGVGAFHLIGGGWAGLEESFIAGDGCC